MINLSQPNVFTPHIKTLHEISYDKNNHQYMTNSAFQTVDFDNVKDSYILSNSSISAREMRSNDALVILNPSIPQFIFIEFKNGDIQSKQKKEEIRSKIAESLLIFNDIITENLTFDRKSINYILVYNEAKNPKFQSQRTSSLTKLASAIGTTANMTYLINGFDRYRAYFHDIKTINETEFNSIVDQLQNHTYVF